MRASRTGFNATLIAGLLITVSFSQAGELDSGKYWEVSQVRPGMKGTGRTVMVGTRLDEFGAEVLGVLKDVSPGRDMILCRLTGCNLEHAGIIQGMSGSPIYSEGKLLGAVAYAWEFAKDPIAGVTPFEQMVKYTRSNDRRLAGAKTTEPLVSHRLPTQFPFILDPITSPETRGPLHLDLPRPVAGAALAGMTPIATPLSATGFGPRALAVLERDLRPQGMAPVAGGGVMAEILEREGNKPLEPGSPLSIGLVLGDFDISGIGTVTHVEGDRVYGFGHPMLSLGACELPMMTGYIHTVYPRASVSMKMGSPLKVVGVLDTDVSTGIAGRLGKKPDLIPMSVTVKTSPLADPRTYKVQVVRIPKLVATLVHSVLTNSVDTEGELPEELTAHVNATIRVQGREPIVVRDTFSGPRYSGAMGPSALFGPIASLVGILAHNAFEPVRIESIDCQIEIEPGRSTASIESIRLASDRLQPGEDLHIQATLRPFKAAANNVELTLTLPRELAEGTYDVIVCDVSGSLRRRVAAEPHLADPRSLDDLDRFLRLQTELRRSCLYLHVPGPERGLAIEGQALPSLPGSIRAVLANSRETTPTLVRPDLVQAVETSWAVEGSQTLKFKVVKDKDLSFRN